MSDLLIRLGLDAAEYKTGLNQAERDADAFSKKIDAKFQSLARTIGSLGVGAYIGKFVHDTIAGASALDDLADVTGSSVESLSKLANQAAISGKSFNELQGLVFKLSAGMADTDESSSKTARALAALGISAKDPVDALNQAAIALDKYSDGVNKAALAKDLFGGRSQTEAIAFVATLKDIARLQDVAATVTAKQAEEAEKLEQAIRRLSVEGTTFKNILLNDMVPALSRFIAEMNEGIKIFGSFGSALKEIGIGTDPFKTPREGIREIDEWMEKIRTASGAEGMIAKAFGVSDDMLERLRKRREFLSFRERYAASQLIGDTSLSGTGDMRDVLANRKPPLDYTGARPDRGRQRKEVDEYEKALEALSKSAAGSLLELNALATGTGEVSDAMRTLSRLQADKVWSSFNDEQRKTIVNAYEGLDAIQKQTEALKAERSEREKMIRAYEQQQAAQDRARDQFTQALGSYAEQNSALERQLAIVGQSDLAHQKLAATLEYEALKAKALAAEDELGAAALEKQYQRRLQLLDSFDQANKALEAAQKSKNYANEIGDAFGHAAEEAIVFGKSAKDVLKGLEQDLLRLVTRQLVTKPLSSAISDWLAGTSGAGGAGSWLFNLIGGGSGAGAGAGWTSGFDLPIGGFAGGTNSAHGGWSWVGERGPELMRLPRGSQVMPHEQSMRATGGTTLIQNITNLPGVSRQSRAQNAAESWRQAQQAVRIR